MPCNGGHMYGGCNCNTRGLKSKIDKLTRMLCYLCGYLTEKNLMGKVGSEQIQAWWKDHTSSDFDRVLHQMIDYSKKAIKKGPLDAESVADHFINKALKVHDVSNFHKKWFLSMAKLAIGETKEIHNMNEEKKKIRRKALKKLSKEEKTALGL